VWSREKRPGYGWVCETKSRKGVFTAEGAEGAENGDGTDCGSQRSEVRRDRDEQERQGRDALIPPTAGRGRPTRARGVSFCPAG